MPPGDRIYLPQDELARFGVTEEDIIQGRNRIAETADFQIERAENYYDRAFNNLPDEGRKAQRTGLIIMAAIYRTLLRKSRRMVHRKYSTPAFHCRPCINYGWLGPILVKDLNFDGFAF